MKTKEELIEKAKEQREKCALNIDQEAIYCGEEAIINRIMNAPNPEI